MKPVKLVVAIGFMIGIQLTLHAQSTASAGNTANSRIIRPIHLTWENPLEFGTLYATTSGTGYAMMDVRRMGANTVNNHAICSWIPIMTGRAGRTDQGSNAPSACTFLVEGENDFTFGVELPPINVIVTPMHKIGSGAPYLILDNFQTNLTGSDLVGHGGTGVLTSGYKYFVVGARLILPSGTPLGEYSGQFNVSVFYN